MTALRLAIGTLLAFAVLCFGAVESWSQMALEIGAALLLACWAIREFRGRRVALPSAWLLAPPAALWLLAGVQEIFGTSVYPYATKIELLKWGACLVLCLLALAAFHTAEQVHALAWFLLGLSFAVSLLGIAQYFTFNGKIYWLVAIPARAGPFGPYVNRDHFAGFVELTAPLGLALLLFGAFRRETWAILALFTVVPAGALVLSASRGGIITFVFQCLLLLILWRWRESARRWAGVATLALLSALFIVWLGISPAIERFSQLTREQISRDRRVSMYRDTWRIFQDHRWLGTGAGTLEAAYPRYESYYDGLRVDHAHNDYLELLAETGLAGGLCGAAFVGLLVWRGFSNFQAARSQLGQALYAGTMVSCVGLLLHSFVDFNLHIPANGLLFLLLASLAGASFTACAAAGRQAFEIEPEVQAA
jgi:O-antigen ligase